MIACIYTLVYMELEIYPHILFERNRVTLFQDLPCCPQGFSMLSQVAEFPYLFIFICWSNFIEICYKRHNSN